MNKIKLLVVLVCVSVFIVSSDSQENDSLIGSRVISYSDKVYDSSKGFFLTQRGFKEAACKTLARYGKPCEKLGFRQSQFIYGIGRDAQASERWTRFAQILIDDVVIYGYKYPVRWVDGPRQENGCFASTGYKDFVRVDKYTQARAAHLLLHSQDIVPPLSEDILQTLRKIKQQRRLLQNMRPGRDIINSTFTKEALESIVIER